MYKRQSQVRLVATLERLVENGLTLVIVTHELEPLRSVLTRAVEVREGRIVADGPVAELAGAGHDAGTDAYHPQAPSGWLGGLGLAESAGA